jgi:ABC-type sugar transport system ATPase subunit
MDPVILLLDEPLSNLDAKLRVEMRKEMKGLQARFHTSIVYVTHDQEEAFELSDRILVINHGTIEQDGTPAEIRKNPKTEFVREFVS